MCIMTLAEVCEINPRKAISLPAESEISFIPMEAVSVCGEIDTSRSITVEKIKNYTVFREGDILFAKITPCMENGKGAIAVGLKNGWGAGSTEFIVLRSNARIVLPQWIYLFLSQKAFRLNCQQNMTGSAGQKRVPAKYLAKCKIPVPSITEQKQIISRIEELFSQLDKGVETLQKTKQQLAVYRQAVLNSAFEGYKEWPRYTFNEILSEMRNGYGQKPDDEGEYRLLRISSVRAMNVDLHDYRLNKTAFDDKDIIRPYDLLFTRYNGSVDYVGVCAYVRQHEGVYAYPDKIIKCRLKEPSELLAKYIQYYMSQGEARKFIRSRIKTTSGQNGIAGSDIKKVTVHIPESKRIERIIEEIEERMSACDNIEVTVQKVLQQVEAMRQSILKQAFEGRI